MPVETRAILYGFWASSCTWRVRAALSAKRIPFVERQVDIVKEKSQMTAEYRTINPSQKVPALVIDGVTLMESMAIVQYLEDTRPKPSLMPKNVLLRAQAREICETIVSGIQPLQNIGLKSHFETEEQFLCFAKHWTNRGLQTLENLLSRSAGKFCVGNELSIADICLVPQIYTRQMDVEKYPSVSEVYNTLLKEELFIETHPKKLKVELSNNTSFNLTKTYPVFDMAPAATV